MKIQFFRMAILIIVALFIAGCGAMTQMDGDSAASGGDDMAAFEKVYQQAEAAWNKVAAIQSGWRDTQDFLKEAKETAKTDIKKAISLAEYAKFESDTAYEQFVSEKNAGPTIF